MTIKQKQHLLAYLGYYTGAVDGIWGNRSRQAAIDFQHDYMEPEDSQFGLQSEERILKVIADREEPKHPETAEDTFWQSVQYFHRGEFACKCGNCGGFPKEPDQILIRLAERTRQHFDAPVLVSSGVRCTAHNAAVGGVSNSRHLLGKAMDFCVRGYPAQTVLAYLKQQGELRYAYAIDESYVHMDVA